MVIKTRLAEIKINDEKAGTKFIAINGEDEAKRVEQSPDFIQWISSWLICPDFLSDE